MTAKPDSSSVDVASQLKLSPELLRRASRATSAAEATEIMRAGCEPLLSTVLTFDGMVRRRDEVCQAVRQYLAVIQDVIIRGGGDDAIAIQKSVASAIDKIDNLGDNDDEKQVHDLRLKMNPKQTHEGLDQASDRLRGDQEARISRILGTLLETEKPVALTAIARYVSGLADGLTGNVGARSAGAAVSGQGGETQVSPAGPVAERPDAHIDAPSPSPGFQRAILSNEDKHERNDEFEAYIESQFPTDEDHRDVKLDVARGHFYKGYEFKYFVAQLSYAERLRIFDIVDGFHPSQDG